MKRREFLDLIWKRGVVAASLPAMVAVASACGRSQTASSIHDDPTVPTEPENQDKILADMEIFGLYQGFLPEDTLAARDPTRTDGTKSGILLASVVEANESVTYKFWHGHGSDHLFTLTEEHFDLLRNGETVYAFTTAVQGHKHCAVIKPRFIAQG